MNIAPKDRFFHIMIHAVGWGVFLLLLYLLVPVPQKTNHLLSFLIPDLFFVLFFYLSFFVLVPQLFLTKKYMLFIIICLSCLILTVVVPSVLTELSMPAPLFPDQEAGLPPGFIGPGFNGRGMDGPPYHGGIIFFKPEFSYTILVFFLVLTLSMGIRILLQWQQSEKEKVNAELAFLKAQINPHFLFNTLNNIYSLAVKKSEETPKAIEMFSEMMRFVIYESSHDYVPLIKKIEYIDTYITLQKLRLSETVTVNYHKRGDPSSLKIAPLILTPFIENAFKYGVSTEKESVIDIGINIESGSLSLIVRNPKFTLIKKNGDSQVGLGNTIKRLRLIYPGRHNLEINDNNEYFSVTIKVNLK